MTSNPDNLTGDGRQKKPVKDFVRELRAAHGAAVNFIQSDERIAIDCSLDNAEAAASLDCVVAQTDGYRWSRIEGRYVLYPNDLVWGSIVSGVDIADTPRFEAAMRYAALIRERVAMLRNFGGPVLKGDPNSPVYTQRVSLSPSSNVLAHFVELLGADQRLTFTVERSPAGPLIMYFEQLPAAWTARGEGAAP